MVGSVAAAMRRGQEFAVDFGRAASLFGVAGAISLFATVHNPARRRGTLLALRPRGYKAPVFVRAGTSDVPTFFQTLVARQYDLRSFAQSEVILRRYESLVARGVRPLIIDCGANVGLSAVWFARAFPAAAVYAVEPDPGNFAVLKRNAAPYEGITPVLAGVWDQEAALAIADPDVAPWEYQVREVAPTGEDGARGAAVAAVTIDRLRAMAGVRDIFIAKIDIEGAEQFLFRSNTDWTAEADVLMIELHDWMIPWEGSSNGFFRCLGRLQMFDLVIRNENLFVFRAPAARPRASGEAEGADRGDASPAAPVPRAVAGHRDYRRAPTR